MANRLCSSALTMGFLLGIPVCASEVALTIQEPSSFVRSNWPVTTGVPLAKGDLKDSEAIALFAEGGREIPLQAEVLSRWPDGSVRWLLLDFQVHLKAGERKRLILHTGTSTKRAVIDNPLVVTEGRDGVSINSGPLLVKLSAGRFRLLDAVWLDRDRDGKFSLAERLTNAAGSGVILTTPDGKSFRADLSEAKMTVEQAGPMRACVRVEGRHSSSKGQMFRYVVRIHVFRGQPFVKLHYTFINDHKPRVMTQIDSLDLVFSTSEKTDFMSVIDGKPSGPVRLFQVDDQNYELDGRPAGKRSAGWAAVASASGGIAVGLREFWQNWPKSLETQPGELRVGICPQFPKGLYDAKPIKEECKLYYYLRNGEYSLKIGVARTHELWATFFDGKPQVDLLSQFFRATDKPLLAQCAPTYVSETLAAGNFPPADSQKYEKYDLWLDGLFQMHLDDRERVHEYGMLNFGDWYNVKWDSWGNLEYDTARCFFIQYLRSGDRRYFDLASQAARHYIDVVHEVNQQILNFGGSANMRPGHVWIHQIGHTGGYYGRYEKGKYHDLAPLIMTGGYQIGMYNWGHQWIGGAFDYYLLTGDRRAREVAFMTADTIAADCPTHYTDHLRDVGWPLNLVIAAYEATGDKKYLAAATRQWELLKNHLKPEQGWSIMLAYGHYPEKRTVKRCRGHNGYMLGLTLSGLARYHRITQDPEVLTALSDGVDQLVREMWSEKHKSFYLTSCIHGRHNPPPALCSVTALSAEAFAYEAALTGNNEHRRIFREAFRTMVEAGFRSLAGREQQGQTGYSSMMFHFTPFGLPALE